MNNKEIGKRIKSRRLYLNLTLKEVAEKVGVASSTIQRYENGSISQCKLPVLESIAKVLNVNPVWLIRDDAPMQIFIEKDIELNYKPIESIHFSKDEWKFLEKYRHLDEKGKHTIHTVLNMEYSRCLQEQKIFDLVATTTDQPKIAEPTLEYIYQTVAAHDDDLTEAEKIEMDKRILEALKKRQK